MINRAKFYNGVRHNPFPGKLGQGQVNGMNAILDEWEKRGLSDLRHLAYMLATAFWETDRTMLPIREYGRGKGRVYGRKDHRTGLSYYGRGLVQLTWYDNYKRMGEILGIDLVNNPDAALDPPVACAIMFEGMLRAKSFKGDFTSIALEDCFNAEKTDWYNARRIINGTDKAATIAGIAKEFHSDLVTASE